MSMQGRRSTRAKKQSKPKDYAAIEAAGGMGGGAPSVKRTERAGDTRKKAYEEAGIKKPREELSMFEVHDCFSVSELVTMEDLFISPEGGAINDIMDGFYDAEGSIPCQIDGGLKCFGHPIGASGLRMLYEMYLQMLGRAGARQREDNPVFGLTHNLGGFPHQNVAAVCVVGQDGA